MELFYVDLRGLTENINGIVKTKAHVMDKAMLG